MRNFALLLTLAGVLTTLPAVAETPAPTTDSVSDPQLHEFPVQLAAPPPAHRRVSWPQPALGHSTSGAPEVLFTFDDGPGKLTENVLDTLDAHGVKAVFFLIGRSIRNGSRARVAAVVDRMIAEGHVVGNHTESHRDLCLRGNHAVIGDEIDESARQIADVARMKVILFRAPYGARCPQLEAALGARGIKNFHWDVDPQEWRTQDTARTQATITGAIGKLRDDQRAVVLAHDINPTTAAALPVILEWIRAENARRVAAGRKPIRVLSPSDIAAEQLAAPLRSWLVSAELGAGLPQLERRLVEPLTAPRAQAGVPSL